MPTVYARIRRQGLPMTEEQKREVGKLIVDAYFTHPISTRRALHRVPETKQENARLVLSYPRIFSPQMDQIIRAYWLNYKTEQKTSAKRLSDIQGVSTRPRKRKPIQPLYSSKPKISSHGA